MIFFRRLYRVAAMGLWTVFVVLLSVPYRFSGWKGNRKISEFVRLWAKGIARIAGLRVHMRGNIPDVPAGLVVSNHMGYLDIVAHGTVFPLRFTSSIEVAGWPVIGQVVGLSRPVWVDRKHKPASRKAARDFAKTMKRGIYLIVYPEGTSTDGKSGILPFKSTPFESAIAGKMPVLPVLTRYHERPGEPTVCWYGDMEFAPHIWQVLGLSSIDVELFFLPPIFPEKKSRKELAAYTHEVLSREYYGRSKIEMKGETCSSDARSCSITGR